jgi:hypothetical protein
MDNKIICKEVFKNIKENIKCQQLINLALPDLKLISFYSIFSFTYMENINDILFLFDKYCNTEYKYIYILINNTLNQDEINSYGEQISDRLNKSELFKSICYEVNKSINNFEDSYFKYNANIINLVINDVEYPLLELKLTNNIDEIILYNLPDEMPNENNIITFNSIIQWLLSTNIEESWIYITIFINLILQNKLKYKLFSDKCFDEKSNIILLLNNVMTYKTFFYYINPMNNVIFEITNIKYIIDIIIHQLLLCNIYINISKTDDNLSDIADISNKKLCKEVFKDIYLKLTCEQLLTQILKANLDIIDVKLISFYSIFTFTNMDNIDDMLNLTYHPYCNYKLNNIYFLINNELTDEEIDNYKEKIMNVMLNIGQMKYIYDYIFFAIKKYLNITEILTDCHVIYEDKIFYFVSNQFKYPLLEFKKTVNIDSLHIYKPIELVISPEQEKYITFKSIIDWLLTIDIEYSYVYVTIFINLIIQDKLIYTLFNTMEDETIHKIIQLFRNVVEYKKYFYYNNINIENIENIENIIVHYLLLCKIYKDIEIYQYNPNTRNEFKRIDKYLLKFHIYPDNNYEFDYDEIKIELNRLKYYQYINEIDKYKFIKFYLSVLFIYTSEIGFYKMIEQQYPKPVDKILSIFNTNSISSNDIYNVNTKIYEIIKAVSQKFNKKIFEIIGKEYLHVCRTEEFVYTNFGISYFNLKVGDIFTLFKTTSTTTRKEPMYDRFKGSCVLFIKLKESDYFLFPEFSQEDEIILPVNTKLKINRKSYHYSSGTKSNISDNYRIHLYCEIIDQDEIIY